MNLVYEKKTNIEIGQTFYGVICVSRYTHDGVYRIKVHYIDWNTNRIVFEIAQPCQFVSCSVSEFDRYVFSDRGSAQAALDKIDESEWGAGLRALV